MSTYQFSPSKEQEPAPPTEGFQRCSPETSNGTVAEQVSSSQPSFGYLDLLALPADSPDAAGIYGWASKEASWTASTQGSPESRDDHLLQRPGLGFSTNSTGMMGGPTLKTTLGTDLRSLNANAGYESKVGNDSVSAGGALQIDRERAGFTFATDQWTGDDKRETGSGSSFTAGVDTEGNLSARAAIRVNKTSASLGGNLDFDDKGGLEHLDVNAGMSVDKRSFAANLTIEPSSIEVKGTTVAWKLGGGGSANLGERGTSIGAGLSGRKAQTRTFNSVEQARTFADSLQRLPQDNRHVDFGAMEPGEAVSFFTSSAGQASGAYGIVGASGESSGSKRFSIENQEGVLVVEVEDKRHLKAGMTASSGMLGVGLGARKTSERSVELRVDPTSPEALEALQALALGGDIADGIPGMEIGYRDVDGFCASGSMDLMIAKTTEESCGAEGRYRELESGEEGGLSTATHEDSRSASFSSVLGYFGYDVEQDAGAYKGAMEAYTPDVAMEPGKEGTRIAMTQTFDFQPGEISRRLEDQVTPRVDLAGIPRPANASQENQKMVLESVIDAEGTEKVLDALRSGPSDFEWEAALALPSVRKALREGGEAGAVVQQLFETGGEDAAEGMRDIAGEEHVERYLMEEGSEVWIGREENEHLDLQVLDAITSLDAGIPGSRDYVMKLAEVESQKLDRLSELKNTPKPLVDEEYHRVEERFSQLQNAVSGIVQGWEE